MYFGISSQKRILAWWIHPCFLKCAGEQGNTKGGAGSLHLWRKIAFGLLLEPSLPWQCLCYPKQTNFRQSWTKMTLMKIWNKFLMWSYIMKLSLSSPDWKKLPRWHCAMNWHCSSQQSTKPTAKNRFYSIFSSSRVLCHLGDWKTHH